MRKHGKLLKFRPSINLDEAAKWLGSLIDEEVTEDDIWELHYNGYIPLMLDGPFTGFPITAQADKTEPWKLLQDGSPSVIQTVFTDYLNHPIRTVTTQLGDAPISMIGGHTYAWFEEQLEDFSIPLHSIEGVGPIDAIGKTKVRPETILQIASCANSDTPAVMPLESGNKNRIWSYSSTGGTTFHECDPSTDDTWLKAQTASHTRAC